jgi:hypothetical protein
MMRGSVVDEEQRFEYDVQLSRRPHESLRERYPDMTVQSTEAQTALRRQVAGPEELSALLVEIATLGLTLTDVHRVASAGDAEPARRPAPARATPADAAVSGTYELRVVGELGQPLVRHLGCTHYPVQKQTLVRLTLLAGELHRFLEACAECGAGLERVRRVRSRGGHPSG